MSRPWDNEPCNRTGALNIQAHEEGWDDREWVMRLDAHARNLERRLRHAERLLAKHNKVVHPVKKALWLDEVDAYLAAAKEGGES